MPWADDHTMLSAPVVGLVGCGHWGQHILRDLLTLGSQVVVADHSEAGRRRGKDGGALAVVARADELPEVDGVVVATSTSTHAETIDALLPRAVPIFVEKPLTADVASAARIAEAAPDRVFVMHKWRYHPGIERLAELAGSGEFGSVVGVETTRVGWGAPHADVDAVWTLAPHDLSIVLALLGTIPRPRFARADRAGPTAAGLIALLGNDPWAKIEVSARATRRRRAVVLRCRDGIASLSDGYAQHVEVLAGYPMGDRSPEPELRPISPEPPLLRELRAFVEHLGGGPPPRSDAAEGALVVSALAELRALAGLDQER